MPVTVIIGVRYTDGRTFTRNAGRFLEKVLKRYLAQAARQFAREIEAELRRSTPRKTGRLASAWRARPVVRPPEFGVYISNSVVVGGWSLWSLLNYAPWSKHQG